MKVRAVALGYYRDKRRPPGEVFILKPYKKTVESFDEKTKFKTKKQVLVTAEEQFSQMWMERVEQNVQLQQGVLQKKFGKGMGPPGIVAEGPASARAAHEPLADEDAIEREEAEDQFAALERDPESENKRSVL